MLINLIINVNVKNVVINGNVNKLGHCHLR